MYIVKTEGSFDAAHFLAGYPGQCRNLHGHRWRVLIEVTAEEIGEDGMVVDFSDLKGALKDVLEPMDHSLILEEGSLKPATLAALQSEDFKLFTVSFRPTAEHFAKYFFDTFRDLGYAVRSVEVYETPRNSARYQE